MRELNIRKLPKEIEMALLKEARARKTTRAKIILEALKEKFHLLDRKQGSSKIRSFFGKMTHQQFDSFREATDGFSKIDREMWRRIRLE